MATPPVSCRLVPVLFASCPADAQPTKGTSRIGILHPATPPEAAPGFLRLLRTMGYVEGQNLVAERRYAGRPERLPDLAANLVQLKVDVIVATGVSAVLAAKNATTRIPIVMAYASNPVERGLVASLARPGGNITGVAYSPEGSLVAKRMELLREALPRARRLAILDDGLPASRFSLDEAGATAAKLSVQLIAVKAPPVQYDRAFVEMSAQQTDALIVSGSPVHNRDRKQLLALVARHRLPAIWEWRYIAEEGGLMSYGASEAALVQRVAVYIDKLLKGANPAELPVEQPTALEFVVNLTTANALGLTIPQTVLIRADHVIER